MLVGINTLKNTIDLGTLKTKEKKIFKSFFQNQSEDIIKIEQINSSCSCGKLINYNDLIFKELKPKEIVYLEIEYTAPNEEKGLVIKSFEISYKSNNNNLKITMYHKANINNG